ncbi:unnamed protein product [Calypogeia fissa]
MVRTGSRTERNPSPDATQKNRIEYRATEEESWRGAGVLTACPPIIGDGSVAAAEQSSSLVGCHELVQPAGQPARRKKTAVADDFGRRRRP